MVYNLVSIRTMGGQIYFNFMNVPWRSSLALVFLVRRVLSKH